MTASIIDRLNSGALHAAAREAHPERVDAQGNIHGSEQRAVFVDRVEQIKQAEGDNIHEWSEEMKEWYEANYVSSTHKG